MNRMALRRAVSPGLTLHLKLLLTAAFVSLCAAAHAQSPFQTGRTAIEIPERGAVEARLLMAGGNAFVFIPPPDWAESINAQSGEIQYASRELRSLLTIKVTAAADSAAALKRENLLEQMQERFPSSEIQEEFRCHTESGSGPGFNLVQTDLNGLRKAVRVAFVTLNGKRIEFVLTSTPESLPKCEGAWRTVIHSFALENSSRGR